MKPDTVYIDPDGRFAIGYYAGVDFLDTSADEWEGVNKGMILRSVTSLEALEEKIAIFEAGLDDIAVERLKFFVVKEINPEYSDRLLETRFAKRQLLPPFVDDVAFGQIVFIVPADSYGGPAVSIHIPISLYYEHVLACRHDLRMWPPQNIQAPVIDASWMLAAMYTDPGIDMPYYRLKQVTNSVFNISAITIRKTEENPTLRLYGLYNSENRITYLPPLALQIEPVDGWNFTCTSAEGTHIMNRFGGMYDIFLRHVPPRPVIDTQKYIENIIPWIFKDLRVYYREWSGKITRRMHLEPGKYLRAGIFLEVTEFNEKQAEDHPTRFVILTSHAVPVYSDANPDFTDVDYNDCRVNMIHYNSMFRVMDICQFQRLKQVTLLEVPIWTPFTLQDKEFGKLLEKIAPQYLPVPGKSIRDFARCLMFESRIKEPGKRNFNKLWKEQLTVAPGISPEQNYYSLAPTNPLNEEMAQFEEAVFGNRKDEQIVPDYWLDTREFEIPN